MSNLYIKDRIYHSAEIIHGSSSAERYAAGELSKYLGKMGIRSGKEAVFTITTEPSRDSDSYAVSVGNNGDITISGGNGRGVIYGVYAFLEKCAGMRFFLPDLEIQSQTDIYANNSFQHNPIFKIRHADWHCGCDSADWCVKNGINLRYSPIPEEMGGYVQDGGAHTMGSFLGISQSEQPCFSDPDVLKQTIAGVRKILKTNPDVSIISVSQNDNVKFCSCPVCKAIDEEEGSRMGSLLRFVNAVASDIADDYPNVEISTLAYLHTRHPPRHTKPLPNVGIRLCSFECCFSHPLNDPSCPSNTGFCQDLLEWSKICDRIHIWDYAADFSYYVPTYPNFGVLRQNMNFFAEHGVKGIYPEGQWNSARSGEFGELRCYLLAKLMMDPMMREEEYSRHMDEFLAAYYGKGWAYIRAYIDWTCEEAAKSHIHCGDAPFEMISREKYSAMEETIENWWKKAEEMAEDRISAVKRSGLQWKCIRIMLHPDAKKISDFVSELSTEKILWNESGKIPDASDFYEQS